MSNHRTLFAATAALTLAFLAVPAQAAEAQVILLNGCETPVSTGNTVSCTFTCDDFPSSSGVGSGLVWFSCSDGRSCGATSVLVALGGCVYSSTGNPSFGTCYFKGIGIGHCE